MSEWHFPRPNLAEQYIKMLDIGISPSLALIAPRRRGKTVFILQDLAPLAKSKQFIPVYASLWQNINSPHEGIAAAIEEAIHSIEKGSALKRILQTKIKKTTIANDLLGKMELEFAEDPIAATKKELALLEKLLARLVDKAGKRKVLLLIDEVQHLSTSPVFDPLTHALRTMLDKRQGDVKSIFTGSSRHYMNLLFNESQSPFYHFVESISFPDLDDHFVLFLQEKLREDHKKKIPFNKLRKLFHYLDHSPYWMMKVISQMITFNQTLEAAETHVLQLMEASEGFADIAKGLKPIDKIIFLALCAGENLFSKKLMSYIDKETTIKGIPANIQRSISRLSEKNLISIFKKGEYHIEKPGLKRFLEEEGSKL